MTPTGVSQVIEAAVKLGLGLSATYVAMKIWLKKYNLDILDDGIATVFGVQVKNESEALAAMYPYAAAVAISGVTFGSILGLVYLFIMYKRKGFGFTREELVNSPAAERYLYACLYCILYVLFKSLIFSISLFENSLSRNIPRFT